MLGGNECSDLSFCVSVCPSRMKKKGDKIGAIHYLIQGKT